MIRVELVVSVSQMVVVRMMITTHKMIMGAQEGLMTQPYGKKKVGRFEEEKEFQDTELENTTICPRCHIDLKTRGRFDTHIKKFHKDIFNFCAENVIVDS